MAPCNRCSLPKHNKLRPRLPHPPIQVMCPLLFRVTLAKRPPGEKVARPIVNTHMEPKYVLSLGSCYASTNKRLHFNIYDGKKKKKSVLRTRLRREM